jgi:hypothetical protein
LPRDARRGGARKSIATTEWKPSVVPLLYLIAARRAAGREKVYRDD